MDVYNVAGSRFYIGGKISRKANMTAADFAAIVWQEVGGWTTAGAIGDTREITSTTLINEGRVVKTVGAADAGDSENTFVVDEADLGQIAMFAASRGCDNYAFRIEWAKGCEVTGTVTMPMATPGLVNWPNHGLSAGAAVKFSSAGGTLPASITAGTTYYVIAAGLTAGTFQVSATPGGTALAFAAAGTGTITAVAIPGGRTRMFAGIVSSFSEQGGESNAAQMVSATVAINSNVVRI